MNHFEDPGELPFLVMEYVEGGTLAERLSRDDSLPEDEVRRVGAEIRAAVLFQNSAHD
jgi:serine/threonine protein kinase